MAITKYESYYNKICEQLVDIEKDNDYPNRSMAFAHWYLQKYYKMSNQGISESLIDGNGDLGIDAIVLSEDNQSLILFQFKLPAKKENINNEISQAEILKTWNGFNTLIRNDMPYTGKNIKFKEYKEQIENIFINNFRICFVSYNKGIIDNKEILEIYANNFRKERGSELEIVYHDRDAVSNIYEKLNRRNNIKIVLKYKQLQSAYNVKSREIDSYVGFVNGEDLVKAIAGNIATIFDENIRLFEYGSGVNTGINRTATSTDQADMFYFYNNGVVFICDKASNSPASNEAILEGTSVVNGCQTLNVLYNAKQKGKLNKDVCVLVRIIEIDDYSERMKITEFLNSQTPIKDSYFIANHPIVRDLQEKLLRKDYFLERQINEYEYMKVHGENVDKKQIIQLENVIQYYVGYWVNKYASLAKRGKNALFDKNKIEDLLCDISDDRVIEAMTVYLAISDVLTMYRKTRRNAQKKEFSLYIKRSQDWLLEHIEEFRYMNTGDILILNAVSNLKSHYKELGISKIDIKELIIEAIFINKNIIIAENDTNTSALTKNAKVFSNMQKEIASLTKRYEIEN